MANVKLSWNANPSDQLVDNYELWEKVDDNSWNLKANVAPSAEPSYTFTPSGGVRQWKVRAHNFVGLSDFCPVLAGPSVPTPPENLQVTVE